MTRNVSGSSVDWACLVEEITGILGAYRSPVAGESDRWDVKVVWRGEGLTSEGDSADTMVLCPSLKLLLYTRPLVRTVSPLLLVPSSELSCSVPALEDALA